MARLGEILLSEKVLTSSELDTALENQVLHGVKLGTCLVEMGYVTDDDLARCLGKKLGQTFLTKDQLIVFGSQYLSVISPTAVKKHRLIPVGINGGVLRIATDQELSQKKQSEFEKFLGRKIEPVAVSGYAIDFFFEEMFGIQRPGRFLPKYTKMKTPESSTYVVGEIKKESAPIIIDGIEWKSLGEVPQDEESALVYDSIFNATLNHDDVPLSLSDTAERLSIAKSREDVAKTVLGFSSNSSGTTALLLIKDRVIYGWKAYVNRNNLPDFDKFSSQIETLPDLQKCVITKKPYLGNSMNAETKMLMLLLRFSGERLAYFPIFLKERVIAVLLCDVSEKMNPFQTAELCRKASFALEILILRSKILSS